MSNIILIPLFAILLAWGSNAFAVGLGFIQSSAEETWQANTLLSLDKQHDVSSQGFILDTSVARNRVFSYRLSIMQEENKTSNGRDTYKGRAITQDFTFAIMQNMHTKLWFGPRVKLARYNDVSVGQTSSSGDVLGLLVGPVIGLNINLSHVVTLVLSYADLKGDYDSSSAQCGTTFFCNENFDSDTTTYSVSILFRMGGDRY